MSSIQWLRVDGIRSYCNIVTNNAIEVTKKKDQQTVYFKKPLTLIWGHNGSGKTTIIEALRVATSGTQPPNSDKGKNFLTDSQLLRQPQTAAIIELGFQALNQREMIVRRHFSVTVTANNSKFSTDRSTIQVKDKLSGNLETLNHTCVDVDRQIPFFLGVSVPVLTNVIFCHQEEQLWMFSDNSSLKKIFDELFDTTQFSKMQDLLKEQTKKNVAELKQINEKVQFAKRDMVDSARAKEQSLQEIQEINQEGYELEALQEQLTQIEKKRISRNLQEELTKCQQELSVQEYLIRQNKVKIDQLEMQQKYSQLKTKGLKQLSEDLIRSETKIKELRLQMAEKEEQRAQLEIDLERKRNELAQYDEGQTMESLKSELKNMRTQMLGVIQFQQNITDEQLLTVCRQNLESNAKEHRLLLDNEAVKNLKRRLSEVQEKKQNLQIQWQVSERKREEVQKEMVRIEMRQNNLQQIINSSDFDVRLQEQLLKQKHQSEQLQAELKDLNNQIVEFYQLKQRNDEIEEYQNLNLQLNELTTKIQEDERKLEVMIRENSWRPFFRTNSSKQQKLVECESLQRQLEEDLGRLKWDQQLIGSLNLQHQQLQQEMQECKLPTIVKIEQSYEDSYQFVKKKLREAKEDKTKYKFNASEFIDQYIDGCLQVKKCILCQQQVDSNILDRVRQRVKNNSQKTQEKINEKELNIQKLQREKEELKQNRDKIKKQILLQQKAKEIEQKIREIGVEAEVTARIASIYRQLKELQSVIAILASSQNESQRDICLIKLKHLEPLNLKDQVIRSLPNLDRLKLKSSEIEERLKRVNLEIQEKENKLQRQKQQQEQLQSAKSELPGLQQKLQDLKSQTFDDYKGLIERVRVQEQEIEKQINLEAESWQKQLQQVQRKAALLENYLPPLEKAVNKLLDLQQKNSKNKHQSEQKKKLQAQIDQTIRNLDKHKESQAETETSINMMLQLIKGIEIQIQVCELSSLQYNDQELKAQVAELTQQIEQQKQIEIDYVALQSKLQVQKAKLIERFNKHQLNKGDIDKRFKNSEQFYLEVLYQSEILKSINEDFQSYQRQVEDAMIQYHRDKMKEINQFLHDTWQKIYHQQDIKYIEIKSDEDHGKKKQYNYRLVMRTFNNTEIDMRGRCSMGQKMLASIVFRMALAESFGSNCGILALDEPTSNLDRQHIETLAESLSDLIEIMNDYKQSFQLIIITHDIDLVKHLRKHANVYYKIQKKENGFSYIEERQIEELQ